jgi:hypothetical protein
MVVLDCFPREAKATKPNNARNEGPSSSCKRCSLLDLLRMVLCAFVRAMLRWTVALVLGLHASFPALAFIILIPIKWWNKARMPLWSLSQSCSCAVVQTKNQQGIYIYTHCFTVPWTGKRQATSCLPPPLRQVKTARDEGYKGSVQRG